MNLPSLSRYSQMAQLHVYYEGPGRIVCKKNLNNCNLKWVCIPFGITHGQQVGNSTSFDLWSVPVISFSEGIFGSPQRDQGSHPTSDGALDAKVTCAIASYVCYSHEHTLLTYSFQVLPWLCFFQNNPQMGASKPQKRKTLQPSADYRLCYQSGTEKERKRIKRKIRELGTGTCPVSTQFKLQI